MTKITTDNWLSSTNNTWSFQNVQSLFPTARIKRGSKAPSNLPVDLQSIGSIQIDDIEGNKKSLNEMLTSTKTDAFKGTMAPFPAAPEGVYNFKGRTE